MSVNEPEDDQNIIIVECPEPEFEVEIEIIEPDTKNDTKKPGI